MTRATIAHLEIDGLDAQGQVLAKLELTVGPFVMKVDDRGAVDGRQLRVTVLGKTATHESEGRNPLDLPMPRDPGIATVLGDPSVAATLENWDVQFAPRDATATNPSQLPEEPYQFTCSAGVGGEISSSPSVGCRSCAYKPGDSCLDFSFCSQFDTEAGEVGEYRCCPSAAVFADRLCTGPTTGMAHLWTRCGETGEKGCAVCWSEPLANSTCFVQGSGGTCTARWCS